MKVVNTDPFWDGNNLTPGFRFHPTDEELVLYYLKRKICCKRHRLDVIGDTDVYKWDPEELPGMSKLKTGDRQWFFFSPRDRKYPNGLRSNRGTRHGYWKVTGKGRVITCGSRAVGLKKTLIYYQGNTSGGERTDWVMHEYTMDEVELSKCKTAKDYYALYKVFKKSGAGPKNGEHYGAPFKEEDWEDDGTEQDQCLVERESPVQIQKAVDDAERVDVNNGDMLSWDDDLDDFMKRIVDDPAVPLQTTFGDENCFDLDEFLGEVQAGSNSVDQSSGVVATRFDPICSETALIDSREVLPNAKDSLAVPEDFLGDYLEMDDLTCSNLTSENLDNLVDNREKLALDCLNEFDFDVDVSSLLSEVGPVGVSQPFVNDFEFDGSRAVNMTLGSHANTMGNCVLNQQFNDPDGMIYQQWVGEQNCTVATAAEANQVLVHPQTSGIVSHQNQDYGFVNHPTAGANENGDDVTDSWFSSALWSFVESVPTSHASASESALVNRAFERLSNFSRAKRSNVRNAACSGSGIVRPTSTRLGKSRIGFICVSLFVVLCSVLWVFVGTSMSKEF